MPSAGSGQRASQGSPGFGTVVGGGGFQDKIIRISIVSHEGSYLEAGTVAQIALKL